MPRGCGRCKTHNALKIVQTLVLPPDSRSDDIILQVVKCGQCGFKGLAVYEESRRGALDSESWSHTAYRVASQDLKSVAAAIRACPSPRDPRCQCDTHQQLGSRDRGGRWNGLQKITVEDSFQIL
jgi:hypothetical protein